MENPRVENVDNLIKWHQRRRVAVVQVTCLLVWQRLLKGKLQAATASETRKRINLITEDDYMDTFDGIDPLVHSRNVGHRSRSKSKKVKKSEDDGANYVKEALNSVAETLRKGNIAVEKSIQQLPIQEEKVWQLLMDMEIEEDFVDRAYLYLVERPKNVRALLGCPREKRKMILMMMVFGPSYSPEF